VNERKDEFENNDLFGLSLSTVLLGRREKIKKAS
jgi:hypothetical protein